jgi:hypothetical protein
LKKQKMKNLLQRLQLQQHSCFNFRKSFRVSIICNRRDVALMQRRKRRIKWNLELKLFNILINKFFRLLCKDAEGMSAQSPVWSGMLGIGWRRLNMNREPGKATRNVNDYLKGLTQPTYPRG